MPEFELDPRLAADTHAVADWCVSRVLLMDDARFPWLILVPRVPGARELHGLPEAARAGLLAEVMRAAAALERATGAARMNVAALGNVVPQLHVHVIARREGDAAWPAPVWGVAGREPWGDAKRAELLARFEAALG
jgi:diadenosine tetraphosphate (Ap4A) HIT family hydrolase